MMPNIGIKIYIFNEIEDSLAQITRRPINK